MAIPNFDEAMDRVDVYQNFLKACEDGDLELIKTLVNKYQHQVNFAHEHRFPLVNAAMGGHVPVMRYLIDELGLDIHYEGELAFVTACGHGNQDMVKYLVEEKRVDISVNDYESLLEAAEKEQADVVAYLLKNGAEYTGFFERKDFFGIGSHEAEYYFCQEVEQGLLKQKEDRTARQKQNFSENMDLLRNRKTAKPRRRPRKSDHPKI